jgi:hypothetical protein
MADETPEKPLGQRLRDLIQPALDDERRKPIQAEIASNYFAQLADALPRHLEQELTPFFNHAAKVPEKKRNPMIVTALTAVQPQGMMGGEDDSALSPIKKIPVKISTGFTDFTPEEIREMPGWIKLHEVCRDLDISIKIMAMTAEESKGSLLPPLLIIDMSKSYTDGAIENSQFYPQLPDKPAQFNKKNGQEFNF